MTSIKHIAHLAVTTTCAAALVGLVAVPVDAQEPGVTASIAARGDDDPPGDDRGGDRSEDTSRSGDQDDRVVRRGRCTGSATWKLKVKTDDGRLEVEGEIDSNRVGQRWRWRMRHNGSVTARGAGVTAGRSGSLDVERRMVNLRGSDRIVFRAAYAGQVCRGVVNY